MAPSATGRGRGAIEGEGDHEGLGGDEAGAVAERDEAVDLLGAEGDGLFAEDVLAGLKRFRRPFDVLVVGEGNVDGVDVRIGE